MITSVKLGEKAQQRMGLVFGGARGFKTRRALTADILSKICHCQTRRFGHSFEVVLANKELLWTVRRLVTLPLESSWRNRETERLLK
jgi:hypothetical protein